MPEDSPFKPAWWYRKEFDAARGAGRAQPVAALRRHQLPRERLVERHAHRGPDEVAGAFRRYEFDVTRLARAGGSQRRGGRGLRRRSPTTSPSCGWTGTRRRPTRTWACGATVYLTDSGPLALRHPHVDHASSTCRRFESAQLTRQRRGLEHHRHARQRHRARAPSRAIQFAQAVALGPQEQTHASASRPPRSRGSNIAKPARLVAVPHGRAGPVHAGARRRRRTARSRTGRSVRFGDPGDVVRADAEGPSPVQGERQADPDPRRRLGLRHDAPAGLADAARSRAALRAGDGPQHHPPRGQARERRVLRPRRPARASWSCRAGAAATSGSTWDKWDARGPPRRARLADQTRSCGCATTRASSPGSTAATFRRPPTSRRRYLDVLERSCDWAKPVVVERHRPAGAAERSHRASRCSAPTTTSPPSYWLTDTKHGGAFGFATEIGPGRRGAADREPEADAAGGSTSGRSTSSGTSTRAATSSRT